MYTMSVYISIYNNNKLNCLCFHYRKDHRVIYTSLCAMRLTNHAEFSEHNVVDKLQVVASSVFDIFNSFLYVFKRHKFVQDIVLRSW